MGKVLIGLVIGLIITGCRIRERLQIVQNFRYLDIYQSQLAELRNNTRSFWMPDIRFFLFGMGNRKKMVYKNGELKDVKTSEVICSWNVKHEIIIPNNYMVIIETSGHDWIFIYENNEAVFINESGDVKSVQGTVIPVNLPDFRNFRFSEVLKVLLQEILFNIIDSKPLPNLFVYSEPWRRDAAMMAMCLEKTGNIDLIRDWVMQIDDPYDHNNGSKQGNPENEADNLGQTLYLLSFFRDRNDPVVTQILEEAKKMEIWKGDTCFVGGRTDFQEVPVYQTKWLKYGLRSMKLNDHYTIPHLPDNYSSLFWWDYRDEHVEGDMWVHDRYPYLGWARDHFYGSHGSPVSNRIYPLTWETEASQADYQGMSMVDDYFVEMKTAVPHTWHAAEVFLYLMDIH